VKIKRLEEVSAIEVAGYAGVTKQIVLGPADGSDEIVLRHFTLAPGAATPRHTHDFPHLVKIEAGRGEAVDATGTGKPASVGDYVYIGPDELHNFKNTGAEPFEFTCIVPRRGE
jgi:quercetin dioxygenase-like cupin family protein